jgi:hypothetical protein
MECASILTHPTNGRLISESPGRKEKKRAKKRPGGGFASRFWFIARFADSAANQRALVLVFVFVLFLILVLVLVNFLTRLVLLLIHLFLFRGS